MCVCGRVDDVEMLLMIFAPHQFVDSPHFCTDAFACAFDFGINRIVIMHNADVCLFFMLMMLLLMAADSNQWLIMWRMAFGNYRAFLYH